MNSRSMFIVTLMVSTLFLSGCATKVKRVSVDKKIDLSGYWNDYDAKLVSEEMIEDCLGRPWLEKFVEKQDRDPVVIVGHVANRSHEHINTQVFTKHLERELLNSGQVVFVASPDERDFIREERDDMQQGYTDPETIKAIGRERGADYMILGSLNSVKDEVRNKFVMYYQANLELIDLTTNEKVWIGQKQIKKSVKKGKFGY